MTTNEFEEPDWGPDPENCEPEGSSSSIGEPDWTEPLPALDPCSSFEIAGPSPFRITGAMLRLMQYHFADANNIQNLQLQDLLWTTAEGCDEEPVLDNCGAPTGEVIPGSKLLIAPHYKRDGLSIQQRPAIFIKREPVTTKQVNAVNRNQTTPHLTKPGMNFEGELHQVYITGRHTIICLASTGSAAEAIAEEVYFRMLQYQSVIRDDLNLGKLWTEGISDVREYPDDPQKSFYAAVTLSWSYTYRWRVIQESPIVKRLSIIPVERN
jgi:hypothetical protein